MTRPTLRHDRRRTGAGRAGRATTTALAATALITVGLAACSGDDDDTASEGTVAVDEDFPGDALDATCARLDAAEGDDQEAIAIALLDELSALGDPTLAANTMELAVIDRCPEWADAVTAAIEGRS